MHRARARGERDVCPDPHRGRAGLADRLGRMRGHLRLCYADAAPRNSDQSARRCGTPRHPHKFKSITGPRLVGVPSGRNLRYVWGGRTVKESSAVGVEDRQVPRNVPEERTWATHLKRKGPSVRSAGDSPATLTKRGWARRARRLGGNRRPRVMSRVSGRVCRVGPFTSCGRGFRDRRSRIGESFS
jgi:hypothetical protein